MRRGVKTENLNIKLVKGTAIEQQHRASKEPKRNRDANFQEPTPTGEATKPAFVKKIALASAIWDEYMTMGLGTRVLTDWDARTFGAFCLMSAEIESQALNAGPEGALTPNSSFMAQYRMYAELFGLVPAGRTRIKEKQQPMRPPIHDEKQDNAQARSQSEITSPQAEDDFFD